MSDTVTVGRKKYEVLRKKVARLEAQLAEMGDAYRRGVLDGKRSVEAERHAHVDVMRGRVVPPGWSGPAEDF